MTEPSNATFDTFVIERTYPKAPARVFKAFAEPAQKRRWYAESDTNELIKHEMDFRVGGVETSITKLGPQTPRPGFELAAHMTYLSIIPDQQIVFAQGMDFGGKRISAALITIEIVASGSGSKLILTHQAAFFDGADGPAMRKQGWESLLASLGTNLT